MLPNPIGDAEESVCQQADIEAIFPGPLVDSLLRWRQEVHEQCRDTSLLENVGDKPIPRTMTAAAASMSENNGCLRIPRESQIAMDNVHPDGNGQAYGFDKTPPVIRRKEVAQSDSNRDMFVAGVSRVLFSNT